MKTTLRDVENKWAECKLCQPIAEFRLNLVHQRGVFPCDVLFVGEAPGKTEDAIGKPFVGLSGRLLDEWIYQAKLDSLFFTWAMVNLLACRPCTVRGGPNRTPTRTEVGRCWPRLMDLIVLANPDIVILLGTKPRDCFDHFWVEEFFGPKKQIMMVELPHPAYAIRHGGMASLISERAVEIIQYVVRRRENS